MFVVKTSGCLKPRILSCIWRSSTTSSWLPWDRKPTVNVVRISGTIGSKKGGTTFSILQPLLERAFNKDKFLLTGKLVAVALEINCSGGSWAQSELLHSYIKLLSSRTELPVYAFVEDQATAGGYYVACSADKIYSTPIALIGGIGSSISNLGKHRCIQRYDIDTRIMRAGKNKAITNTLCPPTPEAKEVFQMIVDNFHEAFVDVVQNSRGERLKTTQDERIFEGALFPSKEAVQVGLIDGVHDLYSFFDELYGNEVRIHPVRSLTGALNLWNSVFHKLPFSSTNIDKHLSPDDSLLLRLFLSSFFKRLF